MSELRTRIAQQGLRYGRVLAFVDACRAGNIGPIAGTSELQPAVQQVFAFRHGNVGLFMASQAQDDAYESPQFATVQSGLDSNLNGDSAGDRTIINANGVKNTGSGVVALARNGSTVTSSTG